MKRGRKPNKRQKIFLTQNGLDYNNWLIVRDNQKEFIVVNRISGKTRVLKRG